MGRSKGGFTLLEVLIALAIVGGLLVSIIELVNHNISVIDRYETLSTEMMLAKEKLTDLKNAPVETSGVFNAPYSDYQYQSRIEDGPLPQLNVLVLDVKRGRDSTQLKMFFRK
ncbi:MAG: prepilin-type N-terminal cleavage/methylation domain-containing protein [Nitrospiraceae bacterium]|nr:prepilin-type N-terminal cleavage/methylation domain-containing protein [Nitrospiraceae bacterium]